MQIKNYSRESFKLNSIYKGCTTHTNRMLVLLILISGVILSSCSATSENESIPENALVIQEQGSFAVGGTVVSNPGTFDPYNQTPEGQTFHGDHAHVFYQIPVDARQYPLVMWHGFGQFSKTWETTPDGREGYQTIFQR